jgi:hypothetical protein
VLDYIRALYDVACVPTEVVIILCAAPGLILVGLAVAIRRQRLRRRKLRAFDPCDHCGFDMRATTGPCPECGAKRRSPPADEPAREVSKEQTLFDDFEDEQWHTP